MSDVTLAGSGDQQGRGGIDRHAGHREQEKIHPTLRYGYARILLLNHKHRVAGSSSRVAYFVFRYLLTGRSKGGEGRDPGRFFLRDFGTGWALTSSRLSELEHSCGISLCYATVPRVPCFASVAKPTFDTPKTSGSPIHQAYYCRGEKKRGGVKSPTKVE